VKKAMMNTQNEINTLTEPLIFELTKAFALPQTEGAKSVVRFFFGKAARHAAEIGIGLDGAIAEGGVCAGARWILPRFVKSYEARGLEIIPPSGPLVIASNHPAFVDSVVISAYVQRPDYKVIIGNIPFFKNLPHLSQYAIFAPEKSDTAGRMQVIRDSIRHFQK
jgi:hypothetical protein